MDECENNVIILSFRFNITLFFFFLISPQTEKCLTVCEKRRAEILCGDLCGRRLYSKKVKSSHGDFVKMFIFDFRFRAKTEIESAATVV